MNTNGLKALETLGKGMPIYLFILSTFIVIGIVAYYMFKEK